MNHIKLILALLAVGSTLGLPAQAKTSDIPAFDIWLKQWVGSTRDASSERLPCLHGDKNACSSPFSSSVAGSHAALRKGAVPLTARPTRTTDNLRRQVTVRNGTWIDTTKLGSGSIVGTAGSLDTTDRRLIIDDSGTGQLGIDPNEPSETLPTQVDSLAEFVSAVQPPPASDNALVNDATAGVGNSAFVSLYDFEDDNGTGESRGGSQEITSVLSAQTLLASAAAVPEPTTMVLTVVGLLALSASMRSARRDADRLQHCA